jgi:hypothetical protein
LLEKRLPVEVRAIKWVPLGSPENNCYKIGSQCKKKFLTVDIDLIYSHTRAHVSMKNKKRREIK